MSGVNRTSLVAEMVNVEPQNGLRDSKDGAKRPYQRFNQNNLLSYNSHG